MKSYFLYSILLFPVMIATGQIIFKPNAFYRIEAKSAAAQVVAQELEDHLKKMGPYSFSTKNQSAPTAMVLELQSDLPADHFSIASDQTSLYLRAATTKSLYYAMATLLEYWEVRKFTPAYTYYPKPLQLIFPSHYQKTYAPSFQFRGELYPGSYDPSFRLWHKLDWYLDDFGLWGHSFDQLVPPKTYFKKHPEYFALYEGKRRAEALCYSNPQTLAILTKNLTQIIASKPDATYFSVSQNDDIIYCECSQCKAKNQQYGHPQGAHYYFLNQVAAQFPKQKIVTLSYLFTYQPPENLSLAPNLHILFSPIAMDRGKSIQNNPSVWHTLQKWTKLTPNVLLWDYTVEFTNYLSPFPNLHTFSENFKAYKKAGVQGIFAQGYADVPGSLYELRQYLLAKLLWDSQADLTSITQDFLRGYYGKAAPFIADYLELLTENQRKSGAYLDIYDGPVGQIKRFLSPEQMDQYDQLLEKATQAVAQDSTLLERVDKVRLDLDFVALQQAKYYGKQAHGLFEKTPKGTQVKPRFLQKLNDFTARCQKYQVYELSEGGLSPADYAKDWKNYAQNGFADHLGEGLPVQYLVAPADDFKDKGIESLVDGLRGTHDFTINWQGWYGNNPTLVINTKNIAFNTLEIGYLEDQRHWIFPPEKIQLWGSKGSKWTLLDTKTLPMPTEDYEVRRVTSTFMHSEFRAYPKLKIVLFNSKQLPPWRERKNKKSMIMLDELELYKR